MFLATSTSANPPFYLVSGDNAVYLSDLRSVQGFKKVGVPVVALSPTSLTALTTSLAPVVSRPWASYIDEGAIPLVDGGAPNSVLYVVDFDGGSSTDLVNDGPPVDGNHA